MRSRGYTLIELLVAMTMASSAIAVSLGMLHRIMREQQFAELENGLHRVAARLSDQLRQDAHASLWAETAAADANGSPRLILHQRAATVTYVLRGNSLERQATRENTATHRDSFSFPDRYQLVWDEGTPAGRVGLTLYVSPLTTGPRDDAAGARRAAMRVEAQLGRDLLYTKRGSFP